MRSTSGANGGIVALYLCQLIVPPTNGSSWIPRPLAFVGPATYSRQPSATAAATRRAHQHKRPQRLDALFSSTTDRTPTVPVALGTSGDWSAYLDESKGLIYYFNPITEQSKWEAPEGTDFSNVQMKIGAAKKVEMRERLKIYLEERLASHPKASDPPGVAKEDRGEVERKLKEAGEMFQAEQSRQTASTSGAPAAPPKDPKGSNRDIVPDVVSEWKEWQALLDEKRGQIYFFNKRTRESSWERPRGFPDFKLSASKRVALEAQSKRYREWHGGAAGTNTPWRETAAASDDGFTDGPEEPVGAEAKSKSLPIVQQGDWSAYFDIKTGLVFYFNEATGENSWDSPVKDFPRIVMENGNPTVLDPGSGNISQERALGYIGVDEMAEALAWEKAKKKERARNALDKAAVEANKVEANKAPAKGSEARAVKMYEEAHNAELERLKKEKKLADEQRVREEAATAKLAEEEEKRRLVKQLSKEIFLSEHAATKERNHAAKRNIQEQVMREQLEKENLKKGRLAKENLEAEEKKRLRGGSKQPALPKEDPTFTVGSVEAMVAPLQTQTLYDVLQCPTMASRAELKRSYLALAKETHPDAVLQSGETSNGKTEQRFGEISHAWKVLGDATSRRRYDRELRAKGMSSRAGSVFEGWVMGAARAMDEALARAESNLEGGGERMP